MALPITYGNFLESNYLDAGEMIAQDVGNRKFCSVSKKINRAFFGGGPFSPKSCCQIISAAVPKKPGFIVRQNNQSYVTIKPEVSCCGCFCTFLETIPILGSALAALNILSHFFGMLSSYGKLKKAVADLNATPRTAYNLDRGASSHYTHAVFTQAVSYTVEQNRLYGSLLALIPFLKPTVRLGQRIIYCCK